MLSATTLTRLDGCYWLVGVILLNKNPDCWICHTGAQIYFSTQEKSLIFFVQSDDPSIYRNDPKILDGQVGQTVQRQIRLLLKDQSDQGLHCSPFVSFEGITPW